MKEIVSINKIYQVLGVDGVNDIFSRNITVSEKLVGSRFEFQKRDKSVDFFNKNLISVIERTLISLYENPISRIEKVLETLDVPKNYRFGFQYVSEDNELFLTDIQIKDSGDRTKTVMTDKFTLSKWSSKLGTKYNTSIFNGKLTESQISDLIELIKTQEYSINEAVRCIQAVGSNKSNELIVKYTAEGNQTSLVKISDPRLEYSRKSDPKNLIKSKRSASDMASIAIGDMLEFMKITGFEDYKLMDQDKNQRYVDLISLVFNDYVNTSSQKYENVKLDKPEFAQLEEFQVNTKYVKSDTTKNLISTNETYEDLYKIMLGTFKKPRKRATDLIDRNIMEEINIMIEKINSKIEKSEVIEEIDGVPSYDEYLKSKKIYKKI